MKNWKAIGPLELLLYNPARDGLIKRKKWVVEIVTEYKSKKILYMGKKIKGYYQMSK